MTQQVVYAKALVSVGYTEQAPTSKFRVFFTEKTDQIMLQDSNGKDVLMRRPAWVWLGKSGAVRIGSVKRIADSIPMGTMGKRLLLQHGSGK